MAPPVACSPPVGDWAIDDKTALLFSSEAPIASTKTGRDDATAVWSFVPTAFDYAKPEALFYFHGHNNYVKVGYCDHKDGLVPDWVMPTRRFEMAAKASGPKYKLDSLPTSPHAPLVLVPEVGRDNPENHDPKYASVLDTDAHYADWRKTHREFHAALDAFKKAQKTYDDAVKKGVTPLPPKPPPPAKPPPPPEPVPADVPFAVNEIGGRMATDKDQVKKMVDDCCNRLRRLPKRVTTTSTYLETTPDKMVDSSKLKRLYLSAHSGGGVPLSAACTNKLARLTSADDMPTDLWVMDATYGSGLAEYSSFCKELNDAGKMGNGPKLSRFVGIVIKGTSTDTNMTAIIAKMRGDGLTVTEFEFKGDSDIPKLKSILMCNPITVIRETSVPHDDIPTKFIPIFLETAGQKGPDCGGKAPQGFLLKVVDTNNQALASANVTVKQQGNQILASKLDANGTCFVQGHDLGQPCDVVVEGYGSLGREGHIEPDDPDDGTLPEYDPGTASDEGGSCGGDYTPPVVIA